MNKKLADAVSKIASKLDGRPIKWAFAGPVNLFIQGIDTDVSAIDIISSKEGAYEIYLLFKRYADKDFSLVVEEVGKDELTYYLSEFHVGGFKARIVGDMRLNGNLVYSINFKTLFCFVFEGNIVPLLTLDEEEKAHFMLKRTKFLKLIKGRKRK